jgi:pimeloyl-ACP methyl ester carboxylesterase
MQVPLLVIACEGDLVSPVGDAERIAAACARSTLLVLSGDRHDEPGQGDPERFEETLRAFVTSVSRPSPA